VIPSNMPLLSPKNARESRSIHQKNVPRV
jgi:hypothetical protein